MADEFTFYFTWTCPFTRPTWYHMTEPARQSCLHHTPQKRSSSTASLTTPSPKRRRKAHDTPTRYALQRMHPGTSPAVAVSSMSLWSILLDSPIIKFGTLTQFMHYTSQVLVKGKTDQSTHLIPRSSSLKDAGKECRLPELSFHCLTSYAWPEDYENGSEYPGERCAGVD